MQSYQFII
jgi:hypothetical protein